MKIKQIILLLSVTGLLTMKGAWCEVAGFSVHGSAWADIGKIMHVSDTLISGSVNVLNLKGNGLQSAGAQFTMFADLNDNLEAALGFGSHKVNHALGSGQFSFLSISMYHSFLAQSRLTYYLGDKASPDFSITLGAFSFKYNRASKNLGLYLLRGPVYPGLLMGGFGDFYADTTKSPFLGAHVQHKIGGFSHHIIFNNERDIPPTFDFSLAYLASYKLGALELGAGVNFYRLIPYNSDLERPGEFSNADLSFKKDKYVELGDTLSVDPVTGAVTLDTIVFTHQGAKLMGMFNLDLKALLGATSLGARDLTLYGEAGVIGVNNYGTIYGNISERIPVMFGFNFPVFGLLDLLSIEVEWYGCKYRNDLALVGNNNLVADWTIQQHPVPSPKPVTYADYNINSDGLWINPGTGDTIDVKGTAGDVENLTEDNIKWSINLEKVVRKHILFAAQVASDHYRPRPVATGLITSASGTATAFSSPKDWYFMFRVGYFF